MTPRFKVLVNLLSFVGGQIMRLLYKWNSFHLLLAFCFHWIRSLINLCSPVLYNIQFLITVYESFLDDFSFGMSVAVLVFKQSV